MSSSSSLQSSFEDVRDDNKFNDVTLAWEDGQLVEAHKVILAGCSPQTNTPTLLSGSSSNDRKTKCVKDSDDSNWLFHNGIYLAS